MTLHRYPIYKPAMEAIWHACSAPGTSRSQPTRWMISTNTVGRSESGFVKICISTPCRSMQSTRKAPEASTFAIVCAIQT